MGTKWFSGHRPRCFHAKRRGTNILVCYPRETGLDDPRIKTSWMAICRVVMLRCQRFADRPSEFIFNVVAIAGQIAPAEPMLLAEEPADYAVISNAGLNSIDRAITTKSRGIAQRLFRGNLLRLWQGACAVTSVQEPRVLRSSHIKPWAMSDVQEKVDHFNGLLLIPNLDALFNEGLISFRDDGRILVSSDWRTNDQRRMHITPDLHLRAVHAKSCSYLEFHRDIIFDRMRA